VWGADPVQQLRECLRRGGLIALGLVVFLAVVARAGVARAGDAEAAPAANAVYFEVVGTCVLDSLNYERRFAADWPLRVGVGVIPPIFRGDSVIVTSAVTMGRLFGTGNNHLEIAVGAMGWYERSSMAVHAAGVVGYRYQPPGSGVVFRLAFTPLVTVRNRPGSTTTPFAPLVGLSVGEAW
jgi:hypothetical protein